MTPGATTQRQAHFWRKFSLLTRGRLDVLRALSIIVAEEPDPTFRETLRALQAALQTGMALSEALEQQATLFSRSVRELVRSAEQSGAWDEILPLIAEGLSDGTLD